MPNIASVLKSEISRLARKEIRAATDGLKKVVSAQRSEVAQLRRRVQELEKALKAASRSRPAGTAGDAQRPSKATGDAERLRFTAKGLASNRKRLGLSAAEFGALVGATGQSIYAWEAGKSQPRAKNLAAIVELRGLGKKVARARLAALQAPAA